MAEKPVNILIAGGGTGGHLFPGIALARCFMARNPENRILFVGTDREFEIKTLEKEGFEHLAIRAAGIKGLGFFEKIKAAFKIPSAVLQSSDIIRHFKPDIVVGTGGYSSGPVALSAYLKGIPVVIQEQNIIPGIANRIIGKFAKKIHVSFDESTEFFNVKKTVVSGNPIRQNILEARQRRDIQKAETETRLFTLFVAGGSQGARSINSAMVEALTHIKDKEHLHVIHQTGETDLDSVKKAYIHSDISAQTAAFFTDIDAKYEQADLIICRAGATTISEITVMGLPSILVPYPFAADNHQLKNARVLADRGASEIIEDGDLSGIFLASRIDYYRDNPDDLWRMEKAAIAHGKPQAAETIVDDCYSILEKISGRYTETS